MPLVRRCMMSFAVVALVMLGALPRARALRCRSGWHRVDGRCVRDTCPMGWHRGRDKACHPRSCPKGFVAKGRLCVQRHCGRGQVRDRRGRCGVTKRMARCGAGRFRNPAGRCVWLPRIRGYGILRAPVKRRGPQSGKMRRLAQGAGGKAARPGRSRVRRGRLGRVRKGVAAIKAGRRGRGKEAFLRKGAVRRGRKPGHREPQFVADRGR